MPFNFFVETSPCCPHDRPGVPASTAASTLNATYNDLDSVRELFKANKGEIAGVILEPVVGNSGFIVPTQEFLEGLRQITQEDGALLSFDEVMTGFRIAKVGGLHACCYSMVYLGCGCFEQDHRGCFHSSKKPPTAGDAKPTDSCKV